jgi:hypothetical protein
MQRAMMLTLLVMVSAVAGSMEFELRFGRGDLSFFSHDGYDRIGLPGCESVADPGEPLLPVRAVTLVVPPDAGDVSIVLDVHDQLTLPGRWSIQPCAVPRPFSMAYGEQVIEADPAVYGSSDDWPGDRIRAVRTGTRTGFRLVSFLYCPVTWNPRSGTLTLVTGATARLSWTPSGQEWLPSPDQYRSAAFQLSGWIDNPQDLQPCRPVTASPSEAVDYLVISSSDYSDSFATFVSWKNTTGILTEFVDIADVLATSSGYDDPEKLRNYIVNRYQNDGVQYVLLAGDEAVLPVRMINLYCEGYSDNAACDLYFSDLDGSWDASGDHDYGQPDDDLDLYSDVAVGRALFDSEDEAALFVERSMVYQQNPPPGDWTERAMLCGAGLFPGYTGAKVCDSIAAYLPVSWEINKAYEAVTDEDGFTTHIDIINSGTNWNHYAGHGNDYGIYWQSSPTSMMTNSIAAALTNGNMAGIHHSIGCMPGAFHHGYEVCADALWHNPAGGAVSVMFNSSYGWEGNLPEMGVSEWMCVYVTEEVFQLANTMIGNAFATSKDRRVPLWAGGYDRELYCIMDWNAYHDPTLEVAGPTTGSGDLMSAGVTGVPVMGNPRPNPVHSGADVAIPVSPGSGPAALSVYDMGGRLVWSTMVDSPGDVRWNTEGAASGIYLVRLDSAASCVTGRFVVLER